MRSGAFFVADFVTRRRLALEWQAKNGRCHRERLIPKMPFFLGAARIRSTIFGPAIFGGYGIEADLAIQTRDLPAKAQKSSSIVQMPSPKFHGGSGCLRSCLGEIEVLKSIALYSTSLNIRERKITKPSVSGGEASCTAWSWFRTQGNCRSSIQAPFSPMLSRRSCQSFG